MTDEIDKIEAMDWSDCPLVQRDPAFYGGTLALREHPRLPVQALVVNYLDGETIETVAYMFEVDVDLTRAIIRYYLDRSE